MTPPESVLRDVESALETRWGRPTRVIAWAPVGGGCINPSAKLETDRGEAFFLKWNPDSPTEMFAAEADGLRALARPGAPKVPEVVSWGGGGTGESPAWLLLEFVPKGRPGPDFGPRLGESLAELHGSAPGEMVSGESPMFGWHRDNFIGSLPQRNDPSPDWASFWQEERLEPQLRMARDRGYFHGADGRVMETLLSRLPELMACSEAEGPALLHGDLWTGNYYPGPTGEPVLIDPAVYRGVGEVDLAMMELFGSLPTGFREGYRRKKLLHPEYEAFRRDLYQLYFLLAHVNLFGGGYVGGSLRAAQRALRGP